MEGMYSLGILTKFKKSAKEVKKINQDLTSLITDTMPEFIC